MPTVMPGVDKEKLKSYPKESFIALEQSLEEDVRREVEARRQAIEEKKARKRRRKKKRRPTT